MGAAATLAGAAIQLSEAAARWGGPERDALKALVAVTSRADLADVRLDAGDAGSCAMPELVVELLKQVCVVLDRGDGVMASELARELTASEAARILGVSRPAMIGLLDKGEIKSHRVGTRRQVALSDVLVYRRRRIARQREAYETLMAEQDELGIYD